MRYMRLVVSGLGLGGLLALSGCNTFGFIRPTDPQTRLDGGPAEAPSKGALVKYLNENSSMVQAVRCDDLTLTCSQGLGIVQKVDLHGKMMCQRPRNFRMSAEFLGKTEVEVGSNDEEFWYWLRRGDPYQIHCSYKDLSDGKVKRLPFPFQPEWVIEALGLGDYGSEDQYIMDTHDRDTYRLVAQTRSPQGNMVRKVIVFRRWKAKGNDAQVTDFLLLDDATGKEICAAHISEVRVLNVGGPVGATVPCKVEMRWPEMKMRMAMRFDSMQVNPNPPIDPMVAFRRRPLTGVPGLDLATMRPDAPVQRVQGFER